MPNNEPHSTLANRISDGWWEPEELLAFAEEKLCPIDGTMTTKDAMYDAVRAWRLFSENEPGWSKSQKESALETELKARLKAKV